MIVHMHSELFNDRYAAVVVLMPKDVTVKVKGKGHLRTGHEGPEVE